MPQEVRTGEPTFQFFPVAGEILTFRVQTPGDAQILLTSTNEECSPMMLVIIGADNNQKTVIRKDGQETNVAELTTPGILCSCSGLGFWVRWNLNVVSVGREGDEIAILSYDAGQLFPVKYVGVRTCNGATGVWQLDLDEVAAATAAASAAATAAPSTTGVKAMPSVATPEESTGISWVACRDGKVPTNAVVGGFDTNELLYIARTCHEGNLVPGKVHPSHCCLYLGWEGVEHSYKEYEVLCAGPDACGKWANGDGANIPSNALEAGVTLEGDKIYVGRVSHNFTITPGKVQCGTCYIPYNGKEHSCKKYEIYVAPPDQNKLPTVNSAATR